MIQVAPSNRPSEYGNATPKDLMFFETVNQYLEHEIDWKDVTEHEKTVVIANIHAFASWLKKDDNLNRIFPNHVK